MTRSLCVVMVVILVGLVGGIVQTLVDRAIGYEYQWWPVGFIHNITAMAVGAAIWQSTT